MAVPKRGARRWPCRNVVPAHGRADPWCPQMAEPFALVYSPRVRGYTLAEMRRSLWALCVAMVCAAACNPAATTAVHTTITSLALDPSEFMGSVPCSADPGAAKAYVAVVRDINDATSTFTSTVQSCNLPVTFTGQIEGHQYGATVAVYDVPPDQITAATMPAWTTSCATDGVGAATVVVQQLSFVDGCAPIKGPGKATTSIVIDIAGLVDGLGCSSSAGGHIDGIRVNPIAPVGNTLPAIVAACGQSTITYATGLDAPATYSFLVSASAPNSTTPGWGAMCSATTRPGVAVAATCDALGTTGAFSIDATTLLQDVGQTCGANAASTYDVVFDPGTPAQVSAIGVPCSANGVVGPVTAGAHAGDIVIRDASHARIAHAICFATALPGQTVTAPCVQD